MSPLYIYSWVNPVSLEENPLLLLPVEWQPVRSQVHLLSGGDGSGRVNYSKQLQIEGEGGTGGTGGGGELMKRLQMIRMSI